MTSTHELLSHTLLAGCDRSSIAQTLGIWKSRLHHRGADFEYGNATGRGATPSFAMQHPLAAGSPSTSSHTGWKANSDADFSTSLQNPILTPAHSFAMHQALAAGSHPSPPPDTQTCFDTNSGTSNTSAPEALVLFFFYQTAVPVGSCINFGGLVSDCLLLDVVPNSWTQNHSPICDLRN